MHKNLMKGSKQTDMIQMVWTVEKFPLDLKMFQLNMSDESEVCDSINVQRQEQKKLNVNKNKGSEIYMCVSYTYVHIVWYSNSSKCPHSLSLGCCCKSVDCAQAFQLAWINGGKHLICI